MSSKVSESKKSALYQKCGYTTLKEVFVRLENVTLDSISESEFSKPVSGEKLPNHLNACMVFPNTYLRTDSLRDSR